MGILADAVLRAGGEAQGVIPKHLMARGGDVDTTRSPCEALRNPECAGVLLAAACNARPCGGGAVPEAGESGSSAGAGPACRPTASTGRVTSGARGEVAGSEDEVKSATLPLSRPNNLCPVGVRLSSLAANREFPN